MSHAEKLTLILDGREVAAQPGQTVLQAAKEAGLEIPTLCYLEKCGPLTTCQVCLVKIDGKLTPSCGTIARPGMVIESETAEVHEARRTALELLFSDHVGDCLAPCHRLCPLGLNIPVLLRHVQADALVEAAQCINNTLPLAGVLGRLCHHPCEQGCRRGHWDDPAGIRSIERSVADHEASKQIMTRPFKASTGKTVAVVGAGPVGLAAAWSAAQNGHAVTVYDRNEMPGGSLRSVAETELPAMVLNRELDRLRAMGIQFERGELGAGLALEKLINDFDAVLLAIGELEEDSRKIGVPVSSNARPEASPPAVSFLKADPNSCQTGVNKVFAAGAAVRPVPQLVRALAAGKSAADCIGRFLAGHPPRARRADLLKRHGPGASERTEAVPVALKHRRYRHTLRTMLRTQSS